MRFLKPILFLVLLAFPSVLLSLARFVRPMAQRLAWRQLGTASGRRFATLSRFKRTGILPHEKPKNYRYSSNNFNKPKAKLPYSWMASAIALNSLTMTQKENVETVEENASKPKPWAELEAKYRKEFEEEEQRLMDEFFAIIEPYVIKDEKWKKIDDPEIMRDHKKNLLPMLKERKSNKLLNSETIEIVNRMLKYYGLDTQKIEVFNLKEPSNQIWIAMAFHDSFGLNGDRLQGRSVIQVEQIIAHEITHVIYNDHYHSHFINGIKIQLEKVAPEDASKLDVFLNKFRKFQERRADAFACLISPQHAYSVAVMRSPTHKIIRTKEDLEMAIKSDKSSGPHYPRDHEFALWASNIYREMRGCIPEDQRAQYEPERPNWFWQLLGY